MALVEWFLSIDFRQLTSQLKRVFKTASAGVYTLYFAQIPLPMCAKSTTGKNTELDVDQAVKQVHLPSFLDNCL